ncbi:MAG: hypothetical protein ACTSXO_05425 [Candidatus Heimdallarchaeota archaeon]|nr:MAG: hypothetical protein DRP02_10625 [Candidatus Gerdarchaeota archaeon]
MTPKVQKTSISIDEMKIPTESTKGTPQKEDLVCALWVFQNCAGEKETKLRRIVSLVRARNSIDWLPVTTDGKMCIVTFIGEYSNLIKLRSSVFGLGTESFSFKNASFWIIPPKDISQFTNFFQIIKSDLQAKEKRLLQQREMELKSKSVKVSPSDFGESEDVELTEKDIDDLRKELEAISSI